jgi:hypothetical protein
VNWCADAADDEDPLDAADEEDPLQTRTPWIPRQAAQGPRKVKPGSMQHLLFRNATCMLGSRAVHTCCQHRLLVEQMRRVSCISRTPSCGWSMQRRQACCLSRCMSFSHTFLGRQPLRTCKCSGLPWYHHWLCFPSDFSLDDCSNGVVIPGILLLGTVLLQLAALAVTGCAHASRPPYFAPVSPVHMYLAA